MKCKWLLIFATWVSVACFADETQGRFYEYEIERVIDGDTVVFDAEFRPRPLDQNLSLRLNGINTPETTWRADCNQEIKLGKKATEFVRNQIETSNQILVEIVSSGSYSDRVVGDLLLDGERLTQKLLKQNHAKRANRKDARKWCN